MAGSRGAVRAIVGIIIAILVLFVVAVVAIPALVDVNQYHDKIQSELQARIGRPVKLGNIKLHLFPLSLRVQDVEIGEDPNFHTAKPFATAKQLDVSAKLMPLLHHQVDVQSLVLTEPVIELVRNERGVWNFASLGNTAPAAAEAAPANSSAAARNRQPARRTPNNEPPTPASPPAAAAPSGESFGLSHLALNDGSVAVTDLMAPSHAAKRQVYDHIDAQVDDFAPNKSFSFKLNAHMPGDPSHSVDVDGHAGPVNANNMSATPIDAKLKLNGVDVGALERFIDPSTAASIGGMLSGDATVRNAGTFNLDGDLKLDKATAQKVALGYPIAADLHISGDLTSEQFHVANSQVKLGNTPFGISGEINAKATPMLADLHITAKDASVSELAKLASGFGVAFAPDSQVSGSLDGDLNAKGELTKPTLNGTLTAHDLKVSGGSVKEPLEAQQVQLVASNLSFADTASSVASTLNGGLNLNLQNANIANLDLMKELGKIAQTSIAGNNLTKIIQTTGGFSIRNGVAHTDNLRATLDGASAAAVGDVNLASEALDARVTAVLTKALAQKLGGSGIGGLMTTALANNQGELVIPVLVSGTLSSPHFAPDLQQIAQMRLHNLLPTADNPGAAAAGILGALSGKQGNAAGGLGGLLGALSGQRTNANANSTTTAKPAQQQPANPLQGLLGQFGKKQK